MQNHARFLLNLHSTCWIGVGWIWIYVLYIHNIFTGLTFLICLNRYVILVFFLKSSNNKMRIVDNTNDEKIILIIVAFFYLWKTVILMKYKILNLNSNWKAFFLCWFYWGFRMCCTARFIISNCHSEYIFTEQRYGIIKQTERVCLISKKSNLSIWYICKNTLFFVPRYLKF